MQPWTFAALFALVVWSIQRAVSKAVLATLTTPQYYLLSALVSLPFYVPVLIADPPTPSALPGALGVSALMAATFGITTEAIRQGPVGRVSPITGLSPALTTLLALAILGERISPTEATGIVLAMAAVFLLGYRRSREANRSRWLAFALSSLAAVQVLVGGYLLRRSGASFPDLRSPLMRWAVVVLALAAVATIGYLWALSEGPAAVIVPLLATSPALGGLLGALVLKERTTRAQYAAILLGLAGAVLLALPG
ncbi:MAG: DMT family transporter [Actinobacteria bacterium]|nr:DMT family transporter [Actinomycetota bacterium]